MIWKTVKRRNMKLFRRSRRRFEDSSILVKRFTVTVTSQVAVVRIERTNDRRNIVFTRETFADHTSKLQRTAATTLDYDTKYYAILSNQRILKTVK